MKTWRLKYVLTNGTTFSIDMKGDKEPEFPRLDGSVALRDIKKPNYTVIYANQIVYVEVEELK